MATLRPNLQRTLLRLLCEPEWDAARDALVDALQVCTAGHWHTFASGCLLQAALEACGAGAQDAGAALGARCRDRLLAGASDSGSGGDAGGVCDAAGAASSREALDAAARDLAFATRVSASAAAPLHA